MLLVCPLEVKRQGGDYNETVCQLAVWSAAALEKLKILASMGRDKKMLVGFPYPGWTVVDHEWQLHISWKEDSGKVVSVLLLRCGLQNLRGINSVKWVKLSWQALPVLTSPACDTVNDGPKS